MANVQDFICDNPDCQAHIRGHRVPILVYVVAGQPQDVKFCNRCQAVVDRPLAGPEGRAICPTCGAEVGFVDLNMVEVPPFVRELMQQPIARREWCVDCFGRFIGQAPTRPAQPAAAPPGVAPEAPAA